VEITAQKEGIINQGIIGSTGLPINLATGEPRRYPLKNRNKMVPVDTSVWVFHLRNGDVGLEKLLKDG
jgi:hypothetical protein